LGDGEYFPTDHDEYIWIPGDTLRARDGLLDIRITEELGEVTYLDKLRLIAVDHPQSLELYSNDKWKAPPYPEFRLFGTTQRLHPTKALDHKGVDVTQRVLRRDRVYADTFARTLRNTAETHSLTLDFSGAPSAGTFLVLHGWVDWADGSTFLERSQTKGAALFPPYLQMRDAQGRWQTVIEDMGIPSGKTKTIAVDLSGKWLSSSRELRIVTNLCVFWDEVFLGVEYGKPEYRLSDLTTVSAELDYHGFSLPEIHPERRQPENFLYHTTTVQAPWNPTPGLYTRYGDVAPLLTEADDQYVILGSGDEIRLRYDATSAPPLPQGWTRDYLLYFDGWAKDADANTAYSQTVEPLPFHGMSRYPYPATERFPDTPAHRQWRERYNTRPALRWLRPLTSSTR
jgi:hypothetical protein